MSANEKPTTYTEIAHIVANLGLIVHESRRSRGLSIRAAAKEIGIDFNTLGRIERGNGFRSDALPPLLTWLDRRFRPTSTAATEEKSDG